MKFSRRIGSLHGASGIALLGIAVVFVISGLAGCGSSTAARTPTPTPTAAPQSVIFGETGGNILPFTVLISSTGDVRSGAIRHRVPGVDSHLIQGLYALLQTDGFFSMSSSVGPIGGPDSGKLFIEFGKKTVYETGSGNTARFAELLNILRGASGLKFCAGRPC